MAARPLCAMCGDVIGVYEPALVLSGASLRVSSLAREPLLRTGTDMLIHQACGVALGRAADDLGAEPFSPRTSP